jgi:type I restriction enzyme M protein
LKQGLAALQAAVKDSEVCFRHIHWLQERWPEARYEDVTGLCKLATVDEIAEQDFSLNPGRYVGVVIEEDGKTEEEFVEEILGLNEEFERLVNQADQTKSVLFNNFKNLFQGAE